MIFVTVGTNEAPFDRLLTAVGQAAGSESLVVQHGSSAIRPTGASCVDFVSYEMFVDFVREARLVVTHAGVGSIMTVLAAGKRPVVVPRLRRFREAVDDHQLALGRHLHASELVVLVEDTHDLPDAIGRPLQPPEAFAGTSALPDELKAYLTSCVCARGLAAAPM